MKGLDFHLGIPFQINPSFLYISEFDERTTPGRYLERYARSMNNIAPSNEGDIAKTLHPSS